MESDSEKQIATKKKVLSISDLNSLTKEALVDKVIQLQSHNVQLKNIIAKKAGSSSSSSKKAKKKRPFDFSKCQKQHVFIHLMYLGWDYQGFATQEDTDQTIEHHLMDALMKCKLIESRETCNYHRCGRTDKGVSSFGQIISLTVRTANEDGSRLPISKMLNRVLPPDIRILFWRTVGNVCSARFDCSEREYRYYFPRGDLNINAMREAANFLVGSHDFRNLCKMDVANGVTRFVRTIMDARIITVDKGDEGYQMCAFIIIGNAFLWHQIRCIVSVLVLVGKGLEKPSIITELLNISENPRKPQYVLACPKPLNLFKCNYIMFSHCTNESGPWECDKEEMVGVIETLQKHWAENQIKAVQIRSMINELTPNVDHEIRAQASGIVRRESKTYQPLLTRLTCQSLEERIDHYAKRRKVDSDSE